MADKKQFSNTKSIVKVETGIVTLISYRHMGTGRFGHISTSLATLYKDVSAMVLFMLFYVLFITILCINNHIEYKNK
jgi:hypothetical protein